MSDNKKQHVAEKPEANQARQERQKWLRKQQQGIGQHEKKKDPEEVPILRFSPNNNFAKCKEALANEAL